MVLMYGLKLVPFRKRGLFRDSLKGLRYIAFASVTLTRMFDALA